MLPYYKQWIRRQYLAQPHDEWSTSSCLDDKYISDQTTRSLRSAAEGASKDIPRPRTQPMHR